MKSLIKTLYEPIKSTAGVPAKLYKKAYNKHPLVTSVATDIGVIALGAYIGNELGANSLVVQPTNPFAGFPFDPMAPYKSVQPTNVGGLCGALLAAGALLWVKYVPRLDRQ